MTLVKDIAKFIAIMLILYAFCVAILSIAEILSIGKGEAITITIQHI